MAIVVDKGTNLDEKVVVSAIDPLDGNKTNVDISDKVVATGEVDTTKVGDYVVTYAVTDNDGNKAKNKAVTFLVKKWKDKLLTREEFIDLTVAYAANPSDPAIRKQMIQANTANLTFVSELFAHRAPLYVVTPVNEKQLGDYEIKRVNDWDALTVEKKNGTMVSDGKGNLVKANFTGFEALNRPLDETKKINEAEADSAVGTKIADNHGNAQVAGVFSNNYPESNIKGSFERYLTEFFPISVLNPDKLYDNMKGFEILNFGSLDMPSFYVYSRNKQNGQDIKKIHSVLDPVTNVQRHFATQQDFGGSERNVQVVFSNHGMNVGDVVNLNKEGANGVWYKTHINHSNTDHMGIVTHIIDENIYIVSLAGSLINNLPNTQMQDILYLSGTEYGKATNVKPTSGSIVVVGKVFEDKTLLLFDKGGESSSTTGLKDVTVDNVAHTLTFTHADGTADKVIDMSAMANDIHIDSSTFDKVTGTLKLTDSDGKEISVDLSDFVSSGELADAAAFSLRYEPGNGGFVIIGADGNSALPLQSMAVEKAQTLDNTDDKELVTKKLMTDTNYRLPPVTDLAKLKAIKAKDFDIVKVTSLNKTFEFKLGSQLPADADTISDNAITGQWIAQSSPEPIPEKTAKDIKDENEIPAIYQPKEIKKAIQENAITPSYNYLVKNGNLADGLSNFDITTNGHQTSFISQKYIEAFSSTASVEIVGNQWGLTNEYFPINPNLTYQADFDVLFESADMNLASSNFGFYLHFGFKDSDGLVIDNTHQQSYGKVMVRDGDVSAGDTEIKIVAGGGVVKDRLQNLGDGRSGNIYYQGFGNDLKLGGYKNAKGGEYSFTDSVNYSREFVFNGSKDLHIDFANSSDTVIKLLQPLNAYQVAKINKYPKLIQSDLGGGNYLYVTDFYSNPSTTLKGSGLSFENVSSNLDQVKHITATLKGQGAWIPGTIPYGASSMSIQAIFGLGGGYTTQSKAYVANVSARVVDEPIENHKFNVTPYVVLNEDATRVLDIDSDIRGAKKIDLHFQELGRIGRQFSDTVLLGLSGVNERFLIGPYDVWHIDGQILNKGATTTLSMVARNFTAVFIGYTVHTA